MEKDVDIPVVAEENEGRALVEGNGGTSAD